MNTLQESLGGGFQGLYDEVVTEDCYHLRKLDFIPDVVFDIGANVGIFTRFARSLWPMALIVAVEPDPKNIQIFRENTEDARIILIKKALGSGGTKPLYHGLTARNGSGETYLTPGLGYPEKEMARDSSLELSWICSITIPKIFAQIPYLFGLRTVVKIDCEGAENCLWNDPLSMGLLARVDYLAMELHRYALNAAEHPAVLEATEKALSALAITHDCEIEGVHLWAKRKNLC